MVKITLFQSNSNNKTKKSRATVAGAPLKVEEEDSHSTVGTTTAAALESSPVVIVEQKESSTTVHREQPRQTNKKMVRFDLLRTQWYDNPWSNEDDSHYKNDEEQTSDVWYDFPEIAAARRADMSYMLELEDHHPQWTAAYSTVYTELCCSSTATVATHEQEQQTPKQTRKWWFSRKRTPNHIHGTISDKRKSYEKSRTIQQQCTLLLLQEDQVKDKNGRHTDDDSTATDTTAVGLEIQAVPIVRESAMERRKQLQQCVQQWRQQWQEQNDKQQDSNNNHHLALAKACEQITYPGQLYAQHVGAVVAAAATTK